MRIGERFRRFVGFIAIVRRGEYEPVGTFFAIQDGHEGWWDDSTPTVGWIVTCGHVVEPYLGHEPIYAIMRDHAGRVRDWELSDWRPDPIDRSLDVAMCPFNPPSDLEPLKLPVSLCAESHVKTQTGFVDSLDRNEVRIELGQQVFFSGLLRWSDVMGSGAIPVVRGGNVAALDQTGVYWIVNVNAAIQRVYEAPVVHLIDTRSKVGFSGSPVFVQWLHPVGAADDKHLWPEYWERLALATGEVRSAFGWNHTFTMWLGMFAGHEEESGIGMVVPAPLILDFLNGPTMSKIKNEKESDLKKKEKDRPKVPLAQSAEPSLTKSDFDDALLRATRLTAPDESAPEGSGT